MLIQPTMGLHVTSASFYHEQVGARNESRKLENGSWYHLTNKLLVGVRISSQKLENGPDIISHAGVETVYCCTVKLGLLSVSVWHSAVKLGLLSMSVWHSVVKLGLLSLSVWHCVVMLGLVCVSMNINMACGWL